MMMQAANRLPAQGLDMRDDVHYFPIASRSIARTRFSPPPKKTANCLTLDGAFRVLQKHLRESDTAITTVAIAGPGDPLATPELTIEAAQLIHKHYPALDICIPTMGIGSSDCASQLAEAGVTHVEMRVEAVRAEIIEKLFAWIRPGLKTVCIAEAAKVLLTEQREGISSLSFHGISVSILTTLYPGYNIDHVAKIASEMVELGAEGIALVPYAPHPGAEVDLEKPQESDIREAEKRAASHLSLRKSLCEGIPDISAADDTEPETVQIPGPSQQRPNIAVVSSNGIEVDLHLGHAQQFLIYGPRDDGLVCFLGKREAPEPGGGSSRWQQTSEILSDCFLLLAASAGQSPRKILLQQKLPIHTTESEIMGLVDTLYGNTKKKKNRKQTQQ